MHLCTVNWTGTNWKPDCEECAHSSQEPCKLSFLLLNSCVKASESQAIYLSLVLTGGGASFSQNPWTLSLLFNSLLKASE